MTATAWVAPATVLAVAAGFAAGADAQSAPPAEPRPSPISPAPGSGYGRRHAWSRAGHRSTHSSSGSDSTAEAGIPRRWQARQQAAREATAKGQPIGINWVNCLPDGMPGMMQGPSRWRFSKARARSPLSRSRLLKSAASFSKRAEADRRGGPDLLRAFGGPMGRRHPRRPHHRYQGERAVSKRAALRADADSRRFRWRAERCTDEITIEDPVTLESPGRSRSPIAGCPTTRCSSTSAKTTASTSTKRACSDAARHPCAGALSIGGGCHAARRRVPDPLARSRW